ncbi:MAG: phytoene desaturase family protein [Kiloniellaceae bacterium]
MQRRAPRVAIVGAGIGGLAAALELATRGLDVTVLERGAAPGGKMREVAVGPPGETRPVDAGPTVLTMPWVFEEIFAQAGACLSDHLTLHRADVLARHAWNAEAHLDLFADEDRSTQAIGDFAGAAEARGYRAFCARARQIYRTLDGPYLRAQRPSPFGLSVNALQRGGWRGLVDLWRISPFESLWSALGSHFRDPRLLQLFGRYATYCGSSPFAAPATLMLVAHVEQEGVWFVEGGMHRLAGALAGLAMRRGAQLRYGCEVTEVQAPHGRVTALRLASGECLEADAVIVNADAAALAGGFLGPDVAGAAAPLAQKDRSLSAVTWAVSARCGGFPLLRHNVFFSRDYAAEFDDIFATRRLPRQPTVYLCAQDRGDPGAAPPTGAERLFCLVNAPPDGDSGNLETSEIETCAERSFHLLERCGLKVERQTETMVTTTPSDFARMFPGSGGALYGRASHGWQACFRRPGATTRVQGLYLAGGSAHPGAGVPMAALSGRLAATRLLQGLPSR